MDWQTLLTVFAIALAAGYIVWRVVLGLRPSPNGCAGGCGCAKPNREQAPPLIAPEELVVRRAR